MVLRNKQLVVCVAEGLIEIWDIAEDEVARSDCMQFRLGFWCSETLCSYQLGVRSVVQCALKEAIDWRFRGYVEWTVLMDNLDWVLAGFTAQLGGFFVHVGSLIVRRRLSKELGLPFSWIFVLRLELWNSLCVLLYDSNIVRIAQLGMVRQSQITCLWLAEWVAVDKALSAS